VLFIFNPFRVDDSFTCLPPDCILSTGFHPGLLIFNPFGVVDTFTFFLPGFTLSAGFHPVLLVFNPFGVEDTFARLPLDCILSTGFHPGLFIFNPFGVDDVFAFRSPGFTRCYLYSTLSGLIIYLHLIHQSGYDVIYVKSLRDFFLVGEPRRGSI